jgi:hypothetical protein
MESSSIKEFEILSSLIVKEKHFSVLQISEISGIDINRFNDKGRFQNTERFKSSDIMKMQEFLKNHSYYFGYSAINDYNEDQTIKKEKKPRIIKQSHEESILGYDKFIINKFRTLKLSLMFAASKADESLVINESYIEFQDW